MAKQEDARLACLGCKPGSRFGIIRNTLSSSFHFLHALSRLSPVLYTSLRCTINNHDDDDGTAGVKRRITSAHVSNRYHNRFGVLQFPLHPVDDSGPTGLGVQAPEPSLAAFDPSERLTHCKPGP
ncbi:uncharacterized protein MYCFIDRAFT_171875 [Pseudocercospora fijiensis CIRAD86]|uniref:Uncharacterized protein n=1 Tax=Pseudocercospora fijiensis (strain CIRAD86) TaxID=383855 RepID=M3B9Y5_PSEFD|nr:uncharacterized protein MYCFIDRAFT_171875 [Pseudocercospora fijiensis CIRAD86]EME86068.1 hypothetical protein MYCFIDRAFT_171875 [Pseudocercospora fijiensis CIRAD86]